MNDINAIVKSEQDLLLLCSILYVAEETGLLNEEQDIMRQRIMQLVTAESLETFLRTD